MNLAISHRAQKALLLWGYVSMVIFGIAYYFLIKMLPTLPATLTAEETAAFYKENGLSIRIGALVAGWTSAFMVPVGAVIAVQMARLEKGMPILSIAAFGGAMMMSIFLVLPPIMWGTAAFSPDRPAEVTLLMHEFANLTLVTTDQYYMFLFFPLAYLSIRQKVDPNSPFTKWYGWYTLWTAIVFEVGPLGFLPRTGPFAWDGVVVYWLPLTTFGLWVTFTCYWINSKLKHQPSPT
ncbi:MAG: hypothetical protein ABWZ40_02710 [Caulobacterales bacterium]